MAEAIQIPAAYLEDVRSALVTEINNNSGGVRADHEDVLRGIPSGPEDRAAAVRILREEMQLLDQILDATGEAALTGPPEAVGHVLEATVRILSGQLTDQCQYSPIDLDAVADLATRLQWAAEKADWLNELATAEREAVA